MKNYVSKSYTNEYETIYTEYELDALRESQKPSQLSINFDEEYEWAKNKRTASKKRYVCSSTRWGLVYRGLTLDGNVRLPFESRSVSELAKLYPQYWHEVV